MALGGGLGMPLLDEEEPDLTNLDPPRDNQPPNNHPILNNNLLYGANNQVHQWNPNDHRPIRNFVNQMQSGQQFGYISHGGTNPNLKPTLIYLLGQNRFGGRLNEDPHQHLATFEEHCATFARKDEEFVALKLNCFHLSLTDDARTWLRLLNLAMAQTWKDVQRLFLDKYFPPSKTQHFRQKITTFKQGENESLSEAYNRWQELLRL